MMGMDDSRKGGKASITTANASRSTKTGGMSEKATNEPVVRRDDLMATEKANSSGKVANVATISNSLIADMKN